LYGKWVEGEEGEMRGWIQTFDMVLYVALHTVSVNLEYYYVRNTN